MLFLLGKKKLQHIFVVFYVFNLNFSRLVQIIRFEEFFPLKWFRNVLFTLIAMSWSNWKSLSNDDIFTEQVNKFKNKTSFQITVLTNQRQPFDAAKDSPSSPFGAKTNKNTLRCKVYWRLDLQNVLHRNVCR